MSTVLYGGDLVICPHCQTNQGVSAWGYIHGDECFECEQTFTVEPLGDGTYIVEKVGI